MRVIIEGYVIIILIWLTVFLSISFTTINLDITAAKKIHNNIISEIENSDGAILESSKFEYNPDTETYTYKNKADNNAYTYIITVEKENIGAEIINSEQTYIYDTVYKVNMEFQYYVPLFGKQVYTTGRYAN